MKNQRKKEQKAKARRERLRQERHVGYVRHSSPIGDLPVVIKPPGELKMSAVLEDFVEPFLWEANSFQLTRNLLMVAAIAWNIGILPSDRWDQEIKDASSKFCTNKARADIVFFEDLLWAMVERKASCFGGIKRMILNVDVTPMPNNDYYISVMSTLTDTDPKGMTS